MINILTDVAVGGTFLSWSLHYLAGHSEYFNILLKNNCTLTENPLTNQNSHNFQPNQPNRVTLCTVAQFQKFVTELENTPTQSFHTLYFHLFASNETSQAALDYINTSTNPLIVVDSSDHTLYHCCYQKRSTTITDQGIGITDDQDVQNYKIKKYFGDSKKVWDDLGLASVWDRREFLALNYRPFDVDHVYKYVDRTKDHFVITGHEMWTMFDAIVDPLFDHINVDIDYTRLEKWKQIYTKWQKIHVQRLEFSIHFEAIIESILKNYSMNLLRFNLDIEQEAAIQHALIYRHNLNLKTWQLEKFENTKQLHSLLEPNIHPSSS